MCRQKAIPRTDAPHYPKASPVYLHCGECVCFCFGSRGAKLLGKGGFGLSSASKTAERLKAYPGLGVERESLLVVGGKIMFTEGRSTSLAAKYFSTATLRLSLPLPRRSVKSLLYKHHDARHMRRWRCRSVGVCHGILESCSHGEPMGICFGLLWHSSPVG